MSEVSGGDELAAPSTDVEFEFGDMGVSPAGPDRAVVAPNRGVFDLLPWRRVGDFDPEIGPVIRLVKHHHPRADVKPIAKAFAMARDAHDGQTRKTGEPYITHPIAVAGILADLGMDVTTVTAALLHDVVEDTDINLADVRESFGGDIELIVDGVTKLDKIQFETREAHQAATMRKMLVSMAQDIRVLLIKLADRLHNMRTLGPLAEAKRRRIAQETVDIYAPLANRLGIREIRWQLEDLAFEVLQPKAYHEIVEMVEQRHEARETELSDVLRLLRRQLDSAKIDAAVTGRPKHYYAIYEKMVIGQRSFDEIYDLVGIRIIVDSVRDCYGALGVVHAMWKPVIGRFKDYIAMPKFNLYQSLHTTVVGTKGRPIEIQIRTQAMHHTAEYGIAAHWRYKEERRTGTSDELAWLNRIVEVQEEAETPAEFMADLKVDLRDEVFVFTPKGDVITLPAGSTPIDFAYAVHTEVGHRCIGSRVNGRLLPLDTALSSGDTIEIFTSKVDGAGPSQDWLGVVASARARNRIRSWFSRERREGAVEKGKDRLKRAMRRKRMAADQLMGSPELETVAEEMNLSHLGSLYAAIGEGHVRTDLVIAHLQRLLEPAREAEPEPAPAELPAAARRSRSAADIGVHVEGLDDIVVKLARCCTPVPGDEIIGYVTRGRGVSVHRSDCANALSLSSEPERLIEVEWDSASQTAALATIQVEALDRWGLLADVTRVLSEHHVNIRSAATSTGRDQIAVLRFEFELADPQRIDSLLTAIRGLESVYEAFRVLPGASGQAPRPQPAPAHGF